MIANGDVVMICVEDRTVEAVVTIASPNGRSLLLSFEAMLSGHVGMMPVLQDEDGIYRSVFNRVEVAITPKAKWTN